MVAGARRRRHRRGAGAAGAADRPGDGAGGIEARAVERVAHRGGRSEARRGLAGEAPVDHVVERLRHLGPLGADRGRRRGEAGHRGGDVGVAAERRVADERLEHQEAEGVDVGAGVGRAPVDLLGREVAGGAHHRAGAGEVVAARGLGDAEVGDLHRARRGHEHVGRLHVAVHEAGAVRGVERVGDLLADADDVGDGSPPRSSIRWRSVGPVDQLHHDVGDAVVVAGVVGGDDVGVRQAAAAIASWRKRARVRVVGGEVGAEHLHRDPARQHGVVGDPDRGHAAAGERLDER